MTFHVLEGTFNNKNSKLKNFLWKIRLITLFPYKPFKYFLIKFKRTLLVIFVVTSLPMNPLMYYQSLVSPGRKDFLYVLASLIIHYDKEIKASNMLRGKRFSNSCQSQPSLRKLFVRLFFRHDNNKNMTLIENNKKLLEDLKFLGSSTSSKRKFFQLNLIFN